MKHFTNGLIALGLGFALTACRPGQKDLPFDYEHVKQEVNVANVKVADNSNLKKLGVPELWAKGNTGKGVDGKPVRVAIVGTGIDYTNADLKDVLFINMGESDEKSRKDNKDQDLNGYRDDVSGYDFFSGDPLPYDWHGHDTYVASLIASTGKSGKGVVGVAPNAELLVARYLGPDGRGNGFDAFEALTYAIVNKAKVIYFEWPNGGFEPTENAVVMSALKAASDENILIVVPSGNNRNQNVPALVKQIAQLPTAVVVAGSTDAGDLVQAANFGKEWVTTSAIAEGSVGYLPGSQVTNALSSTSIAAAYVTGAAALLLGQPNLSDAAKVKEALLETFVKVGAKNLDVLSDGTLDLATNKK